MDRRKLEFLAPDQELYKIGEGVYTEVYTTLQERKGNTGKYVFKEYSYPDERAIYGVVKGEEELFGDKINSSLIRKAKVLQDRYRIFKEYFADTLPNAVLPTYYMVGRAEGDEKGRIFEAQLRLPNHAPLSMLEQNERVLPMLLGAQYNGDGSIKFGSEYRARLENLCNQIKSLILKLEGILFNLDPAEVFCGDIPDLHTGNVAVTNLGEIKLFDFNRFFPRYSSQKGERKIEATVRLLERLLVYLESLKK